jgi:hypothetical protein
MGKKKIEGQLRSYVTFRRCVGIDLVDPEPTPLFSEYFWSFSLSERVTWAGQGILSPKEYAGHARCPLSKGARRDRRSRPRTDSSMPRACGGG